MRQSIHLLLLALCASGQNPAAHAASVPARVLDPFGSPVPEANVAIYRTISDPAAEHGFRFETVSAGIANTNGDFALESPDVWTNLKVKAERTGYVPWASDLRPGGFVTLHFAEGRPTGVVFLMERDLGPADLLALERTTDDKLRSQIRQLLSTSMLDESAWDTVFHIDDRLRPHLISLCTDPVVSNRVQDVLAHWYPESFSSESCPRLDYPWKAVADPDIDKAIRLAVSPELRPGEEGKFGVRAQSFDSTRTKVIVRCSVHHGPLNARGYVLFFKRVATGWQLVYAGMSWVA
jgi:hypothetical protein